MQIPVTTSGRIHPYHPNMRPRLSSQDAQNRPLTPLSLIFRTFHIFRATFLFVVVFNAPAQNVSSDAASILTNHGEPMRVGYRCIEEDLQWAGMSCNEDPCPVFLELSAVAAKGRKILAAGNLHSASATLSSILLQSDDAGATWKEQAARVRGDAIEQLEYLDSDHAWAAGETEYPLPRDPFVLMTTDGGASWREHPVGEEGNAGSVLRLWFDSPEHGELIVDGGKTATSGRYLSFESETGGDSWKLSRTADRPTAPPHAPPTAEDPNWRIRTAKDGSAYEIENRGDDSWYPVASFLIETANCKIDPGQSVEPKW
jgi:hypothetical protein